MIEPGQLTERDSTKIALPYGADGAVVPVQKFRDVQKLYAAMTDGKIEYVLSPRPSSVLEQSGAHGSYPYRPALLGRILPQQMDTVKRKGIFVPVQEWICLPFFCCIKSCQYRCLDVLDLIDCLKFLPDNSRDKINILSVTLHIQSFFDIAADLYTDNLREIAGKL